VLIRLDNVSRPPTIRLKNWQRPPRAMTVMVLQAIGIGRHESIGHGKRPPGQLNKAVTR
jgi:hypothetical protein